MWLGWPNGPFDNQGRRFWDAGPSCCNFEKARVDHVSALRAAIERALSKHEVLDRTQVYVVGYSNGGFMAHRLACELPELVRGVVSVAGAGALSEPACAQGAVPRVLQIHGDADAIVLYAGGHLFRKNQLPEHASAWKTVADWARHLGCSAKAQNGRAFDFEARVPGAETRTSSFGNCRSGAVELWTVVGGDHYIGLRAPSQQAIWSFLTGD